ncbi:MAG: HlyU family transcriptional regulator [Pacificibacter sp.]|uniref:HlyU family transcriptional regulator n=1 Tax=Pacificibacter sp. TaxID=1917866 RepID=UPI00321A789B
MSLLSKLFGGKAKVKDVEPELYKDFLIFPEPVSEGGAYRIAARIEKEIDGEVKVHHMKRADTGTDLDDVTQGTLTKAKIFIDQMGDRIFE